jgi:hypothetical protein
MPSSSTTLISHSSFPAVFLFTQAPHTPACGHVFCYVCLRSRVSVNPKPSNQNRTSRNTRQEQTTVNGSTSTLPSSPGRVPQEHNSSSFNSSGPMTSVTREDSSNDSTNAALVYKCPVCAEPARICKRWTASRNF